MPYIKSEDRGRFESWLIESDNDAHPETEGELNYILTRLVHQWLGGKPNYAKFNAAIGVMESAKLELYRRMVAPYEDIKIAENGDV